MALEFHEASFGPLTSYTTYRDLAWSRLILSFKDADSECFPSIELTLLQPAASGATISELERQATDRAKTILRAALDLLEASDVTSILDKQAARDAALD